MVLDAASLPLSVAASPRLEVRARTGSTNADLVAAVVAEPSAWPHLSAIVTDDQTAGRGRLGRSWTAPPGSALAVSTVVGTEGIPIGSRGWIPLIAGTAMAEAVSHQLPSRAASVKWPNDVLVDGLKISGILAEAVPDADVVVVGAGVNTTMAPADLPVPTAVSFAAIGLDVDVDRLLADYLGALRTLHAKLADAWGDADGSGVRDAVSDRCATLGAPVRVQLPGGGDLVGAAERIGTSGELVVRTRDGERAVTAGDVVHVR